MKTWKFSKLISLLIPVSMGFLLGCQTNGSQKLETYKLVLTDELSPAGMLPELIEVNQSGLFVIWTNRFNTDGTKYQKGFFMDLNPNQKDSLENLVDQLINCPIPLKTKDFFDSTLFKIHVTGIRNGKRENYFWLGDPTIPEINTLVEFCRRLPEQNRRYKMKEAHYFSTTGFCTGEKPL